jgi:tetratricopeptide (TPR) repeat protein
MSDAPNPAQLLAHAARCYRNAGLAADAVRCLERAGDWHGAALLHRDAGRWGRAADCFERAGRHAEAADCHLHAGRPAAAARSLELAGDPLGAGWVLAHLAGQPRQAAAVLARPPSAPGAADGTPGAAAAAANGGDAALPLATHLVRARIAAHRDPAAAALLLRQAAADLAALERSAVPARLLDWAHTLAEQVLARADLAAELHAAAHRAGLADSGPRWEAWAQAALGDSTGVPEPPPTPPEPLAPAAPAAQDSPAPATEQTA